MDLVLLGLVALRGKWNVDIKVLSMEQSGEPDNNIGRTSLLKLLPFLILNRY